MSPSSRSLDFGPTNSSPRSDDLRRFAEQLAAAYSAERERHEATRRALAKAQKGKAVLQQTLQTMQVEWQARKQSWHSSHKKHLHLRVKYTKLLTAIRRKAGTDRDRGEVDNDIRLYSRQHGGDG